MKRERALAAILTLIAMTALAGRPAATAAAPWQLRLEVASIHLSVSGGGAPVRNRTALFEIGRSAIALGASVLS
jgi:hypothetical protein